MSGRMTEQERFWAGRFGRDYSRRNSGDAIRAANVVLFSRILSRARGVGSLIEFGANIGLNLEAIRYLLPTAELSAVEINTFAAKRLTGNVPGIRVYRQSLFDFRIDHPRDFVLVKGVLIHQAPDRLGEAYDILYQSSSRYICVAEYYNPSPVEVKYRGHDKRLFKRDFAGEMLDRHTDLRLIDYGFVYHRDSMCPLDDITWFLMERR